MSSFHFLVFFLRQQRRTFPICLLLRQQRRKNISCTMLRTTFSRFYFLWYLHHKMEIRDSSSKKYLGRKNKENKTGVINDPLGQPTVPAGSDCRWILKFCAGRPAGRTDNMCENSDHYRPGLWSASWIKRMELLMSASALAQKCSLRLSSFWSTWLNLSHFNSDTYFHICSPALKTQARNNFSSEKMLTMMTEWIIQPLPSLSNIDPLARPLSDFSITKIKQNNQIFKWK